VEGGDLTDFSAMAAQNPLSGGGVWTNNTQGTGGNVAMNAQSSMQVLECADGGFNIAGGDDLGQDEPPAPASYMDSFAFKPGIGSGNLRITAVMYVQAGYFPAANHEIELLLGCESSAGNRTWISCTWDRAGIRAMALMNGPPNGYSILNPNDAGPGGQVLLDLDEWKVELYRASATVVTYRNGVEYLNSSIGGSAAANAAAIAVATGTGLGIGSFRRTILGGSAANAYGYRSVRCEAF
jgi:hypothetical protein